MTGNATPISANNAIFNTLRNYLLDPANNLNVTTDEWNTFIALAVRSINTSNTLVTEINDLAAKGWIIGFLPLSPPGTTPVIAPEAAKTNTTLGVISVNVNPANLDTPSSITQFVASLAYELGHAEDPQLNTINYAGNSLALGADVALQMIGEGKSVYNRADRMKISRTRRN